MTNKDKILDISKRLKLSHIGSCLSVLPILEEVYAKKKPEDKVIMDNAHAHLAHLVVTNRDAEELIKRDIHCNRESGCDASGGSLGHGIGISIGIALANPKITVLTVISDGSIMEGSGAEALRIAKTLGITNIEIHANFNGFTATSVVDLDYVEQFIKGFGFPVKFHRTYNGLPELDGIKGHYLTLNENKTETNKTKVGHI